MSQIVCIAPNLPPQRVYVLRGEEVVAMGTMGNLECIRDAANMDGVTIYVRPEDLDEFREWHFESQMAKRRLH